MSELYVEAIGDGPPILMMHGLGLDHTYLRPFHDPLAETHRVIYYDHRWNGRSVRAGDATHKQWHADAATLIDRAVVYGHSYGAWLAIGFALAYPEKVERLVLCAASPQFDYADEVIATAQQRDPVAAKVLVDNFAHLPTEDAALGQLWQQILPLYFKGRPRPEILANTIYGAHGFAAGMAELATFSTEARLPELQMPVLILDGNWDYITPPKHARRLLAAPHATYEEFADSGHFPFVEEPDRYLAVLRHWLLT